MNDFPFYRHWGIKVTGLPIKVFEVSNLEGVLERIIKSLELSVVGTFEYSFSQRGETRVLVLSQSHMVIHTWPESLAMHIDLMVCSDSLSTNRIEEALATILEGDVFVHELNY